MKIFLIVTLVNNLSILVVDLQQNREDSMVVLTDYLYKELMHLILLIKGFQMVMV